MLHKKRGFTLTELLAVVVIIGILSSVALPQYRRSIQRAEAVEGLEHLRAILDASMRFRSAHDAAPTKLAGLDVSFYNASSQTASTTDIDNFRFTFSNNGITACRLPTGDGSCSSYYFTGYYNNPTYGGKGALTCTYVSDKYDRVCEVFGTEDSENSHVFRVE